MKLARFIYIGAFSKVLHIFGKPQHQKTSDNISPLKDMYLLFTHSCSGCNWDASTYEYMQKVMIDPECGTFLQRMWNSSCFFFLGIHCLHLCKVKTRLCRDYPPLVYLWWLSFQVHQAWLMHLFPGSIWCPQQEVPASPENSRPRGLSCDHRSDRTRANPLHWQPQCLTDLVSAGWGGGKAVLLQAQGKLAS